MDFSLSQKLKELTLCGRALCVHLASIHIAGGFFNVGSLFGPHV